MSDISVQLDALTSDAQAWQCASRHLKTLGSVVDRLTLSAADFCCVADASSEAAVNYERVRADLSSFLAQGSAHTLAGAKALERVRSLFEENEEAALRLLDGVWEPED